MDAFCTHRLTTACGGHRVHIHNRVAAVFYQAANAASWPTYGATAADERHEADPSTGAVHTYVCDYVMVGMLSVAPPSWVTINVDAVVTSVELPNIPARRREAVAKKRGKHGAASRRVGHHFIPLEFSSLGGVGPDALGLLRRMADALALQSCALDEVWRQQMFVSHWVRRISVVMQQAVGDEVAQIARLMARKRQGGSREESDRRPPPSMVAGVGATWRDVDTGAGAYGRACRAQECSRGARD